MAHSPLTTGTQTNGIDPTFDFLCFLFGPSKQRADYSATFDYADYEAMRADYERRGTFTVNTSHSEGTIFGTPHTNWMFRYWHDLCHIRTDAPFTADGERMAASEQMRMVRALQGPTDEDKARWCALIDCEVNGQTEYYMTNGTFPTDQRAFARQYLASKGVDVSTFPRDTDGVTIAY